jgi:hypothetical protein
VNTFDRVRRVATVVLTTVVLLSATQWAQARFTGSSNGALQVSTASMAQPAAVVGSFQCKRQAHFTEGIEFRVTDFADAGPEGAQYQFRVFRADQSQPTVSQLSAGRSATLDTGLLAVDGTPRAWTLTIHSVRGSWTGPAWSRTIICPTNGNSTGSL